MFKNLDKVLISARIYTQRNHGAERVCKDLFFRGLETNAAPIFLNSFGCFPNVCTHARWGVYVRIFPSIDIFFCSNVFGSFTFVASLVFFFLPPGYTLFSCFCRVLICTHFYLTFNLSLAILITLEFTPVFCCCREIGLLKILWQSLFHFDFFSLDGHFVFRPSSLALFLRVITAL